MNLATRGTLLFVPLAALFFVSLAGISVSSKEPDELWAKCVAIYTEPQEAGEVPKSRYERARHQLTKEVDSFLKDSNALLELAALHKDVADTQVTEWTVRRMIISATFQILAERSLRSDLVWWLCRTDIVENKYISPDIECTLAVTGDQMAGGRLDLLFAAYWTSDGLIRATLTKIILRTFPKIGGEETDFSSNHIARIQQWFEDNKNHLETNSKYLHEVSDFAIGVTDRCPPLIGLAKKP